jgi:hypothetical protein
MKKIIVENGNQAKVAGFGGDIGISPSVTLSPFFPAPCL